MTILAVLVVLLLIGFLLFWTYELSGRIGRPTLRDEVDEILESNCVDQMMQELDQVGESQFTREEIWERMSWIWREIRVFAWASDGRSCNLLLVPCGLLYALVWSKTLIWPHGGDLRILLGAELFMLCQMKRGG